MLKRALLLGLLRTVSKYLPEQVAVTKEPVSLDPRLGFSAN